MTTETKTVWVTYTNTDLTEGRGQEVVFATCELEATARRLAKKCYVQGSDGPVRPMQLLQHEGRWYIPANAVALTRPTDQDRAAQETMDKQAATIAKAKAAGLTDEDLLTLMTRVTP